MAVTVKRSRSIAHRWGPVCPASVAAAASPGPPGPPGLSSDHAWALGVRFDEEDEAAVETFVVKLTPGRAEIVDQLPGRVSFIASSTADKVFVLDDKGNVVVQGRRHRLASPRALSWLGDGVVLAAADRVWLFSGDGADVREGPAVKARRIATSAEGLVTALDDGTVLFFDDVLARGAAARGQAIALGTAGGALGPLSASGAAALAVDDAGRVLAASGKSVLYAPRGREAFVPLATAPFDVHAVALHNDRVLLSSRAHGLFHIELEGDATLAELDAAISGGVSKGSVPKGRVMPWRPSLRAHTLAVRGDTLVVASDLFVAHAGADGDFMTRDLTPFVRQAEQRWPRFTSEDPITV